MGASTDGSGEDDLGFIGTSWPKATAWVCFSFVVLITSRNAYRHLVNYSRPDLQPHVLRIIVVAPIYALSAALCLTMTRESACFFVRSVRDVWEAVVIYSFLTLIVEYMGGEHLCLNSISQREKPVDHLFPLNLCLPPIPTASMIRGPKIGALQFVVVKPVVAIISIIVYACGKYKDAYYQWTLLIVYNISYSVALYALYLIYWASHEHQSLQSKRPLLKFVSVKMIVFLTFWQALLLPMLPLHGVERWEDFILALEMGTFFCLLMNAAFSWKEFHSGLRSSGPASFPGKPIRFDTGDLIDLGDGFSEQPPPPAKVPEDQFGQIDMEKASSAPVKARGDVGGVVKNAAAAFCPKDVLNDASRNFSRRYQQHVLIESAQEYELQSRETAATVDLLGGSPASSPKGDAMRSAAQRASAGAAAVPRAAGSALRTFRARTYLIGSTLSGSLSTQEQSGSGGDAGRARAASAPADTSEATTAEADSHRAATASEWPAAGLETLDFDNSSTNGKDASNQPQVLGMTAEHVAAVGGSATSSAATLRSTPGSGPVLGTSRDVVDETSDSSSYPIPRFRGEPVGSQVAAGAATRPSSDLTGAAAEDRRV